MAEASAKQPGEQDPSMEEILQSIRRIIAEDGDPAAAPKNDGPKLSGDAASSDVLELTEMVTDDGSVVSLKTEAPAETPPPPASADVLSQIDSALAAPAAETPKPAAPVAPITPPPAPAAVAAPSAPASVPLAESLLSEKAAVEAASSIKKLQQATEPPLPSAATTPSPVFQSGNTVEAMVAAMLRPMIKEWLDANLPKIVERLVALEIRRLTK